MYFIGVFKSRDIIRWNVFKEVTFFYARAPARESIVKS